MAKNLHQFMFIDVLDEADHIVCLGFTKNVFAVCFNSAFADPQVHGYLFVAELAFNKTDHFQFTVGKGRTNTITCFGLFQLLLFHKTIRLSFG
jgi:hypothetical protein